MDTQRIITHIKQKAMYVKIPTHNPRNDWWQPVLLLIVMMLLVLMCGSCTTTKYVAVPEYHTEYIVRTDTVARMDSILLHDSVYVYHSGDTVIVNKVKYRDRVRNVYQTRTDTILKADTIYKTCTTPVELSASDRRYIKLGKCAIYGSVWLLLGLVIIGIVFYWLWKHK